MCRMYPQLFAFFPTISLFFFFCHSGIFVLLKRTQGWTKPESVLFDHFSAVFLFIGVFILMFGDALKKKIRMFDEHE